MHGASTSDRERRGTHAAVQDSDIGPDHEIYRTIFVDIRKCVKSISLHLDTHQQVNCQGTVYICSVYTSCGMCAIIDTVRVDT